jgi:hypothetical protein
MKSVASQADPLLWYSVLFQIGSSAVVHCDSPVTVCCLIGAV